jgi:hypothetical protein
MSLLVQIDRAMIYLPEEHRDPSVEALTRLDEKATRVWEGVSQNAHRFEAIIDQYNQASRLESYNGAAKVKMCNQLLEKVTKLELSRQKMENRQEALRSDLMTWIQTDANSVNLKAFQASIEKIDELINISDGIDEYDGFDGLNLSKSCVNSGPKTNVDKLRRIIEMDLEKETQKNQCAIL